MDSESSPGLRTASHGRMASAHRDRDLQRDHWPSGIARSASAGLDHDRELEELRRWQ
jgi:hypothetical protein